MVVIFGEKLAGVDYQTRLGVYAIVSRETSEVCLVQAPNGAWLLPGGEIDPGESQEIALKRELIEELGAECELEHYFGQADEYFYSSHRDKYFYNPAYIYSVSANFTQTPLEDFNHIEWFDAKTALTKLKRGSHRWGLEQWLGQ